MKALECASGTSLCVETQTCTGWYFHGQISEALLPHDLNVYADYGLVSVLDLPVPIKLISQENCYE